MIKKTLIGAVLVGYILTGFAKDAMYYREHPGEIRAALLACASRASRSVSCDTISHVAKETSGLLYELEQNPQKFGLNIMLIQANIAKQMQSQHTESEAWIQAQTQLHARLALIKLLQSPYR